MDLRRLTLSVPRAPRWLRFGVVALAIGWVSPGFTQSRGAQDDEAIAPFAEPTPAPAPPRRKIGGNQTTGRVAESAVGSAGQRQTRAQTIGIKPMARISGRIFNRVQNRNYNRIDRNYNPAATTSSPFENAEERTRQTNPR